MNGDVGHQFGGASSGNDKLCSLRFTFPLVAAEKRLWNWRGSYAAPGMTLVAGMKQRLASAMATISPEFVLLPVFVIAILPAVIAHRNDVAVLAVPWRLWVGAVGVSLAAAVCLTLVHLVIFALGGRSSFELFVRFCLYFALWTGLVLPIAVVEGMQSPSNAPVVGWRLVLAVGIACGLVFLSDSRFQRGLRLGIYALLAGNVAIVIATALIRPQASPVESLEVSADKNVFVLSFDDLSGSAVEQAILADPTLASELGGFVVFDRVAGSSPATSASIAAELYGNRDFKERASTTLELWQLDPDLLLTNALAQRGIGVTTYGPYSQEASAQVRDLAVSRDWSGIAVQLLNLSLATTTGVFTIDGPIEASLARVLSGLADDRHADRPAHEEIMATHAPGWDRDLTMSVFDLRAVVGELTIGADGPAAFFLHFTHTHFPVEWDEECQFRGDELDWYQANQSFAGTVNEAKCALRQALLVIGRLDELGVSESSLIVIKSDHGKPLGYAPADSAEALRIAGHPLWGASRYAPFLAIKPFGETASGRDGPRFDPKAVILDDLARTVCEEVLSDEFCGAYPGFNVLRDDVPPDSLVTAFVVRSDESSFEYEDHQAISFPRGDDVFASFLDALIAEGLLTGG